MVPGVCHVSVTRLRYANTNERIEMLFGVETLGGPRNIVFDFPNGFALPNYFGQLLTYFVDCMGCKVLHGLAAGVLVRLLRRNCQKLDDEQPDFDVDFYY